MEFNVHLALAIIWTVVAGAYWHCGNKIGAAMNFAVVVANIMLGLRCLVMS